jgi:undecaprenyl-diphosphatase
MHLHFAKRFYLFLLLQIVIALTCFTKSFAQFRLQPLDDRISIDIQETRTPEQTGIFKFLSNSLLYGDVGVPVGLFTAGAISNDKGMRENSLFIASSTAITYGLTALIKIIVKRPRPYVQNKNIIAVYPAGGFSFPSGHSSSTFSTATALSMAYPKWYVIAPAFLWSGSVAYSRIYLGVHYTSDVAAGALLGTGTALSMSFMKK